MFLIIAQLSTLTSELMSPGLQYLGNPGLGNFCRHAEQLQLFFFSRIVMISTADGSDALKHNSA